MTVSKEVFLFSIQAKPGTSEVSTEGSRMSQNIDSAFSPIGGTLSGLTE